MRVIRSVVSGLLVAAGAYLVGMVAGRLAYELYPWADDMIYLVFVTWVAAFFVVGAVYGYLSKSRMMRSLVLAIAIIAALTGFYIVTLRTVDEHHSTAYREMHLRWNGFFKANERKALPSDRCQWQLLEERFEAGGRLDLDDVVAANLYCTTWSLSLESVHFPIDEFWSTYDEQGQYPFADKGDDA